MSVGPAADAIAERTGALAAQLSGECASRVTDIAERASGPLVVAVVGRLKTGKSTLVNAILTRDVAPVDGGECTRLVTRFVRGDKERVMVTYRDGTMKAMPFQHGKVPSTLPDLDDVTRVEVTLVTSRLDDLVLVDTPGLASLTDDVSVRTENLLGTILDDDSQRACADADAVLYVITSVARNDDIAALTTFLNAAGDHRHLSSVLVLNRADELGGGVEAADEHTANLAERHRDTVAAAVPVVAVAASGIRCGRVGSAELATLADIARLDDDEREMVLLDVAAFCEFPSAVTAPARAALHTTIGFHAARLAVEHLRSNPKDRIGALDLIERWSRIANVDTQLARLRRRADAIKAQHAIAALNRLAWDPHTTSGDAARLKTAIADIESHPALDVIEQLAVLERAATDPGLLELDELDELDVLFSSEPVHVRLGISRDADVSAPALAGARRWQAITASDTPPQRRHAAAVARGAYLRIWEHAQITVT